MMHIYYFHSEHEGEEQAAVKFHFMDLLVANIL